MEIEQAKRLATIMRHTYAEMRDDLEEILMFQGRRADQGRISDSEENCFHTAVKDWLYTQSPMAQVKVLKAIIMDSAESGCRFDRYLAAYETVMLGYEARVGEE